MHRDPICVGEDDTLTLATQLMSWNGVRCLPVVRDRTLVGVLTERDILSSWELDGDRTVLAGTVGDAMTRGAVVAHPTESLAQAAARMVAQEVDCLPVIDAGRVIGVLVSTDIVAELGTSASATTEVPEPTASDLMTPHPVTAHADDVLVDAAIRMVQSGVRHLPVVDGQHRVIGMLSDRDVRAAVGNPMALVGASRGDARLAHLRVADAMTRDPRVLTEDARLSHVLALLIDERFGAAPIVDARGTLVGIVSYVDVLRSRQAA